MDARKHFVRVVPGTHESNMIAVATTQVDVATGNTPDLERYERREPEIYARLRVIWRSPLIPGDPMVWRAARQVVEDQSPDILSRVWQAHAGQASRGRPAGD